MLSELLTTALLDQVSPTLNSSAATLGYTNLFNWSQLAPLSIMLVNLR